jgi:hypothetical protein
MDVAELAPGLWRWTAPHPEWTPDDGGPEGWDEDVAAYYCEAEGDLLLIDPIVPSGAGDRDRFWEALDRDVARVGAPDVVLTGVWHVRSSEDVLERYPDARLWVPAGEIERLPAGLRATHEFRPGAPLPGGAAAIEGIIDGYVEALLWLPSHAALVSGDTLLGDGPAGVRLCPESWREGTDTVVVRDTLRERLAGLPVERILVSHGEPVLEGGRQALDAALGVGD